MASIEHRRTKDKKVTHFRVRWQEGGSRQGGWQGETFESVTEAKRFKGLVDTNLNRRPTYEQLVEYGFDYLLPPGYVPSSDVSVSPDRASAPTAGRQGEDATGGLATTEGLTKDAVASDRETDRAEGGNHAPTFGHVAETYIDELDHVLGYSKRRYRGRLRNHVLEHLGDMPINDVGFEVLKAWQRAMVRKGLSRKTIANIRGEVIIPVLKDAARPRGKRPALIAAIPEFPRLPPGRTQRRDVITSEADIELYMRCAYEVDPEAGDLLMVAIATAMRWGDLAGLRKRDVDLGADEIRPTQVLARGAEDHDRWEIRPWTKSIAGDERIIPIPSGIDELLRRRLATKEPDELVFTAPRGGHWDHSRFRERRYLPILKLAQSRGLAKRITPHALRHSLLTMLADAGTDPKVMQHMAGHGSIATLYNKYIRPTKKQRSRAAETVSRLIGSALPLPHKPEEPAA
jgi:integrase